MRHLRLTASLVLTAAGIGGLVAAQLPATPSSAVAATPPTQPGSAFATSTVLAANPEYGGLSLVARAGQSTASYTGSQSVANSQAVDLGFLGGVSTGSACTGGGSAAATPSPTATLNALVATSAAGASTASADGNVEAVTVNPSPESAAATTSMVPVTIPGLLTVTAQAASHVAYASGKDQEADANTSMTLSLLGGLISIDGLTWNATQDSGTTNTSTATFTVAAITIGGTTMAIVDPAQLTSAIALVNQVVAALGITITKPTMSTDPVTNAITISPLQIQLTGTALTAEILGQLTTTQTALELEIANALASFNNACITSLSGDVGTGELVAGIVEGILSGGGVVELQLGGASADTEVAPNYANPLGATGAAGGNDLSQLGTGSGVTGGFTEGLGGGAPSGSPTSAPGSTGHGAATSHPQSTLTPVALVRCVTSSPSGRPGCWSGAATAAAAALLVAGGSLFAADFARSRRKLSRPKETL